MPVDKNNHEIGGSPTRVDGLETVCRRLLLNNDSNTKCNSLLDWLILRCNHQWQFMNLAGTPVTREVLVEEVLKIMNAVKDNVTDHDIVQELEQIGIVCDCHMNFVRDIHARALDVRNDDQCTMEELDNKLFPKTRRGKRDKYHPPTTKKSGDDQCPPEFKRQKCGNSDQEEEGDDPRFDSVGELLCDAETETEDVEGAKSSFSATRLQSLNPPPKQPKSRGRHRSNEEIREMSTRKKGGGARFVRPAVQPMSGSYKNGGNNRTCMPIAIAALLQDNLDRMNAVLESLLAGMPEVGDMEISHAEKALAQHHMYLERVTHEYNKKGGHPYHLFKEHECKLIVLVKLTNTKKQSMNHCIAWDGITVHDHPFSVKVNNTYDRRKHLAKNVFKKLYPKNEFHSWQITNVFRLHCLPEDGKKNDLQ